MTAVFIPGGGGLTYCVPSYTSAATDKAVEHVRVYIVLIKTNMNRHKMTAEEGRQTAL